MLACCNSLRLLDTYVARGNDVLSSKALAAKASVDPYELCQYVMLIWAVSMKQRLFVSAAGCNMAPKELRSHSALRQPHTTVHLEQLGDYSKCTAAVRRLRQGSKGCFKMQATSAHQHTPARPGNVEPVSPAVRPTSHHPSVLKHSPGHGALSPVGSMVLLLMLVVLPVCY